jgi:hypothetical protein
MMCCVLLLLLLLLLLPLLLLMLQEGPVRAWPQLHLVQALALAVPGRRAPVM